MKTIALSTGLAIAFAAPAFAQDAQEDPLVSEHATADSLQVEGTLSSTGHSTTVYHGPHDYPLYTHGRAGDPAIIDHSCDTLIVEPTHSTITMTLTTDPPPQ